MILLGLIGLAYAGLLAIQHESLSDEEERHQAKASSNSKADGVKTGVGLMLSPVIAVLFLFYMIVSMAGNGLQSFSVVAMIEPHGTTLALANFALTTYFVAAAIGTLIGGWLADNVVRHNLATAIAFAISAAFVALLGIRGLPLPGVVVLR